MQPNKIKRIIDSLGGVSAVATRVGLRSRSIWNWVSDGYVPPKHHPTLFQMGEELGITIEPDDLDPAPS